MELQTMPLRFRVWDKGLNRLVPNTESLLYEDGCSVTSTLEELASLISEYADSFKAGNYIISQDTGLKDKNGKSIYTGDIVRYKPYGEKKVGIIKYDADLGMLEVENILDSVDVDAVGNVEGLCRIDIRYAEVIGNIWQNTELLEVE